MARAKSAKPMLRAPHAAALEFLRFPQDVLYFGFLQSGSIILKCQPVGFFMDAEAAKSVGVGKTPQRPHLFPSQRR